jgi:uncharacterized protein (TIGR03435 family)
LARGGSDQRGRYVGLRAGVPAWASSDEIRRQFRQTRHYCSREFPHQCRARQPDGIQHYHPRVDPGSAFDARDYQILNAPGWIDGEHYDVAAKAEAARDFTGKQMEPLIQDLLKERFGFRYSREKRSLSGYALLVTNGGTRLKVAEEGAGPGTGITTYNSGKVTVDSKRMSMTRLAVVLESLLKQPVVNQTGLAGDYSVRLEYDSGLNPDSPLPSLFTALQGLGLRLQAGKVPVEMILVEDVERPSEN